jgi:hypothetical protein
MRVSGEPLTEAGQEIQPGDGGKRRALGGGVNPVVNTAGLNAGQCTECGKCRCRPTRALARRAARMVSPERRLRIYPCSDYWHMTSSRGGTNREPPWTSA